MAAKPATKSEILQNIAAATNGMNAISTVAMRKRRAEAKSTGSATALAASAGWRVTSNTVCQ